MIFKQETIQSWFTGINSSINNEVIKPFQNAEQVIWKYNQAIEHSSLTQNGWNRLLAQSDDGLKTYLTNIKGTTASMTGYTTSLQGNIVGFRKVSSAIAQYNSIASTGTENQTTFSNAVSATNIKLGSYLVGLNGATASLGGYVLSLIGATAKTIALRFATIALNSAITMGTTVIISSIVSAISSWIHETENMISTSEDALNTVKSLNDELKNNQKTISDTAKRFAELSQGVDQLTGKNISLNSDDYEEFLNLSGQLAEMFPTLTRNYNDNGNAIVQLSGDVDTIVGSLHNLIEAQRELTNRQIADKLPTIFDGLSAKSTSYERQLSDLESKKAALVKLLGDVQNDDFANNFMSGFAERWIDISGDNLEVISQIRDDYIKILTSANIDFEELTPEYETKDGIEVPVGFTIKINSPEEDVEKAKLVIDGNIEELAEQYESDIQKLNEEIKATNDKNKANWNNLSNSIFAWLSTDDSFKVMDDATQATVQNIVNGLDWSALDFSSWEDAEQYIQDNILSLFNTTNGKRTLADIQVMLGIQTQFNNGDISVKDYQDKIQELLASIDGLPDETQKSIMWLFGVSFEEDGTTTSDTDTLVNNVKSKLQDEFKDKVGELSLEDLKIAAEQIEVSDATLLSWDQLKAKIEETKKASKEPFVFSPSALSTAMESLSKIQSLYNDFYTKSKEGVDFTFDISDIENLREEFGKTCSSFDEFERLATSSSTTADELQKGFDKLATEYVFETNILNGLNVETREQIQSQLELQGIVGANSIITEEFAQAYSDAAVAGIDFANATYEQINAFISEGKYAEETRQKIYVYAIQKRLANENCLNTTGDIAALEALCKNLGIATDSLVWFARAKSLQKQIDAGVDSPLVISQLEAAKNKCKELASQVAVTSGGFTNMKQSADNAAKGASKGSDKWKEQYEKELRELERTHDLGLISEEKYWQDRIGLNEKFFGKNSKHHQQYLEEYQDNEKEILEGIKNLWKDYYADRKNDLSGLISYAEKLYDKQIDGLNEQKDLLEEQRDAEEKYWEERIQSIQTEVEALEEANDTRRQAIDLQEKQYQLQRAMQQRTTLLYTENGMTYVNDAKAERDARNDLADAQHEVKVSDLKKQQEGLQKQLDAILKNYDAQIESIEKQINSLQKVKSAWSDIAANQELKELEAHLKTIFGNDVKDKILGGNTEFINGIVAQYSSASKMLNKIENATLADIQNMVAQYGILPENLMPITGMAAEIKEALGDIDTSGFNASLDSAAQSSSKAAAKVRSVTTALNDLSNDVSNYQIPAVNADNFMSSFSEDGGILSALRGFTERFQTTCDDIPDIWNGALAEAFGQGGGNGDPHAGGLPSDAKYNKLFAPLIAAIDNCKTNMEAKLRDCLGTFTNFQTDLSDVIGAAESGNGQSSDAKGGNPSGSGKASGAESGTGTIVGAVREGGTLIDQALNGEKDSWSSSFVDAACSIHNTAGLIVECIESMASSIVNACAAAINAINMMKQAEKGNGNSPAPSAYRGNGHGASGAAYASGIKGTKKDEKNAIVSEYGQMEMTVFPNGQTVITDSPTAMDMPKGTVVYNKEETEKILKNKVTATGSAHASGTGGNEWFIGKDGHRYRPIRSGDPAWELMQKFEPLLEKIKADPDYLVSNAMIAYNRQIEKIVKQINYANVVTNTKNVQPVVNQTFNITLPNVTNATSAEELMRDLQSLATKKFQVNW